MLNTDLDEIMLYRCCVESTHISSVQTSSLTEEWNVEAPYVTMAWFRRAPQHMLHCVCFNEQDGRVLEY